MLKFQVLYKVKEAITGANIANKERKNKNHEIMNVYVYEIKAV